MKKASGQKEIQSVRFEEEEKTRKLNVTARACAERGKKGLMRNGIKGGVTSEQDPHTLPQL